MMTETQKKAMEEMDRRNLGAVVTRFGWTWKETIRRNEQAAVEALKALKVDGGK